ncbi:hypothetical protein LG200_02635 [Methylobacillus caricis]|uniref:hypothetical protein n=1 Tax=Methylobacillus caricis TaxID=1971611 RepID=UPI001CFFC3A0|nr:hypothetical protein [Methylobacillus caricis]MCB5186899.1 hypothetical protein [Methylobacillus caricis]
MCDPEELKNAGLKAILKHIKVLGLPGASKDRLFQLRVYKLLLRTGKNVDPATAFTPFEQTDLLIRHHFKSGKTVFGLNQENRKRQKKTRPNAVRGAKPFAYIIRCLQNPPCALKD